jgi:acyl-CoA thioester hydrolase
MEKQSTKFSYSWRVRFAEVDSQGVVFNAHYLTYLDTVLTEYMRYLGMDVSMNQTPKQHDFQLIKTTLEFKAPAKFDDELTVIVRTQKIGNSSIVFEANIFKKSNQALLVTSELVWVYADLINHVSAAIPQSIRAFFESDKA